MPTTTPVTSLSQKAQACLSKQVPIPSSPLWNMAKAAKRGSQKDFDFLQDALDYLTCKAREKCLSQKMKKSLTVELKHNSTFQTTWSVDSIYDFEPFDKQNYYTEIPLGEYKLIIYDGLSEYMTKVGAAKVFNYRAEWSETWK